MRYTDTEHKIEMVRRRMASLRERDTEIDPTWLREIAPLALEELKTTLEDLEATEEDLHESEERFRLMVESVRDYAIFMLDPEGRVVSWNSGAERIHGYRSEEVIGRSFECFYTPEDLATGKPEGALSAAAEEGRYEDEGLQVRKTGEVFWASVIITALRDEAGNLRGYAEVVRDITERKMTEEALRRAHDDLDRRVRERTAELAEANRALQAEIAERVQAQEALEKSERRFRALIENSSDAISLIDADGAVLFASPAMSRMLGYAVEGSTGRNAFEWIHPDDQERITGLFSQLLQKPDAVERTEFRYRHQDGSWRWIDSVCANLLDDPSVQAIVANYRDITRRKAAEEELLRLASIVACSDDAIIGETLEGTIVDWNHGAERTFGYSAEEVMGCHISILAPLDRLDEMPLMLEKLKQGKRIESFETVRLRKDGGRIDVSLTVSPIEDPAGRVVGASAIARDITAHKQLEQRLFQARHTEAIGRLAGGVAHGFNNLLQCILGYTELAAIEPDGSNRWREWVSRIADNGQRGAKLVAQLLAFSRQTLIDRRPVSLTPLVREAARTLKATAPGNISIQLRVSGEIARVNADPVQVRHVIASLCHNAMQAMPDGGTLTLTLENAVLDETHCRQNTDAEPGKYVCLVVRDTGVGMTPDVRAHLFEPFFTTRGAETGTGLGLAMVYGIVRMHDGHVSVFSEPGSGSEFRVYLPAVAGGTVRTPSVSRPQIPAGTEMILLVEDEQSVLSIARAMLERLGYRTLTAANGEEALEVYRAHRDEIGLVLTDMVMPKMGGQRLCETLERINPGVKVLLMSGYNMNQEVTRLIVSEAKGFLQKPFDLNGLGQAVRKALGA